jgi:uncharacterized protein DUF2845
MLRSFAVIYLIFCFHIGIAFAGADEYESCRCKNELATKGDSKQDVQRKCGQPVQVSYNVRRGCYEMWLYNFGPNEFMQGICFERGSVQKVLSLTRGY